jgi:hypothetical protein
MQGARLVIGLVCLLLTGVPISAQDDSCPNIVQQALDIAGEVCAGTARNQACYGNVRLDAEGSGDDFRFEQIGDIARIANLRSLTTYPLDEKSGEWGIAVMKVQANLPDSLPGQNLTFILFGDATLENAVDPRLANGPVLSGFSKGSANLRSGPGTNFSIQGGLSQGEAVTLVSRNAAGDWLLVRLEEGTAWVSASLISSDADLGDLIVVEADTRFTAPMQAFRLRNGLADNRCDEAPVSGLVVQSPEGMKVQFQVNGVDVEMGSTALFRALPDAILRVVNLEGAVSVSHQGQTVTLQPGESLDVPEGSPAGLPALYGIGEAQALPLGLLPDIITIPPVILSIDTYDVTGNGIPNPFPIRFANGDGDAIVKINQTLIRATSGRWTSGDIEIDESHYANPYGGDLTYTFTCEVTRPITVTYEIRLVDAAGNSSLPYRYTVTCSPP